MRDGGSESSLSSLVSEVAVGVTDGSSHVDWGVINLVVGRFFLLSDLLGGSHGMSDEDFGVGWSLVRDGRSESGLSALMSEVAVGSGDTDVSLGSSDEDGRVINLFVR